MPNGRFANAPFTEAEVRSLNEYQSAGVMHPFTCGNDWWHRDHPDAPRVLVAHRGGWVCPAGCGYEQNWAHQWMADGTWREMLADMRWALGTREGYEPEAGGGGHGDGV